MKMKKLSIILSLVVGIVMATTISSNEALAFGERYMPQACIRNDGVIDSKCDLPDPTGPCDKEKLCPFITHHVE